MKTLLSIGHGYSARALARLLLPQGWRIIATTRSAAKADMLRAEGVEPIVWTGGALPLSEATHLLTSVAPDGSGDPVLAAQRNEIAAARHLEWVGYLSTVGVYGDHGGAPALAGQAGTRRARRTGAHRVRRLCRGLPGSADAGPAAAAVAAPPAPGGGHGHERPGGNR